MALRTLKLDGYRAVVEELVEPPDNTVIDGEVIAFDQQGRTAFNALQDYGSVSAPACTTCSTWWCSRVRT
jgi:ATP-dependent DNA ligase